MSLFNRKNRPLPQPPAALPLQPPSISVPIQQVPVSPIHDITRTSSSATSATHSEGKVGPQQQPSGSLRNDDPRNADSKPARNNGSDGPKASVYPSNVVQANPRPAYPWSVRHLSLPPPVVRDKSGITPSTEPSPSPFPRYGSSLPATATASGDLYLFGGLVRESARNDLYRFSLRDYSATLFGTEGDVPSQRVGHASALLGNVLIVWGGDTTLGSESEQLQDDGLYLLNLLSRDWVRVLMQGQGPFGRYGHTATMVGHNFVIFGGQVGGEFLDEIWSFDLNSLRTKAVWEFIEPKENRAPAKRTGHACVAYGDRIIIFGGTDGQYHYNDTWSFHFRTRQWCELQCIGFIPSPREGHAAALVDDIIYVFGGRGVDGKDLGDLCALKISNQRWYMFQNMGPAPSGRSGHAMASVGSKVYVLGGEAFMPSKVNEPSVIHILDTKHIKYPVSKNPSALTARQDDLLSVAPGDAKIRHLITRLQAIFRNEEEYRLLLACRTSSAQRLLDMFQRLLDTKLEVPLPSFHRNLIVATQRLAGKSGLYPVCFELTDVTTIGNYSESAGAFADIYRGSFQGRAVCLKVIRLDKKTQVEHLLKVCSKEAILWGQLSHPNLLPFYGLYRFNGRISFVAPWMHHGDVTEYLKSYPAANRVLLAFDTAEGLRFLHKNGIVHGDLKGPNILVNESGRACVSDFGLSSVSDKDILAWISYSSIASKGGTVRWQSPELFDPEGEDDIRNTTASDMYAWSCVLYEIFTGQLPFAHISRDTVLMLRVGNGERPARPPESSPSWTDWGLTEAVWTLMQDCWKTVPTERPTIDEVRKRLARVLPEDTRPSENGTTLSSAQFREMTRKGLNHDEMSLDTLERLMNAS